MPTNQVLFLRVKLMANNGISWRGKFNNGTCDSSSSFWRARSCLSQTGYKDGDKSTVYFYL